MGTFTPDLNLYKPADGEVGWGSDVDTNFDTLDDYVYGSRGAREMWVNVKDPQFGALGDDSNDDTGAVLAAITQAGATGGSVYFPPGVYDIRDTIDLSAYTNIHFVGGAWRHSVSYINGQRPPAVFIRGDTLNSAPVFYADRGGNTAGHTFENLMVLAGLTGFQYLDAANVTFKNCSVAVEDHSANADNTSVLLENTFWADFDTNCAFSGPKTDGTKPAVILRSTSPILASTTTLIRFIATTFWSGGVRAEINGNFTSVPGRYFFENCLVESSAIPLLNIVMTGQSSTVRVNGIVMKGCEIPDALIAKVPVLGFTGGTYGHLDAPVMIACRSQGAIGNIAITSGEVTGAVEFGNNRVGGLLTDQTGAATSAGSMIWDKEWGLGILAAESSGETSTDMLADPTGPALRLGISGDTQSGVGLSASSARGLMFGAGGATSGYDTNLYRSAANILKTDDKLVAAAGIGVGNSASATTPGSVTKKMEVFDAAGTSLGFIAIYNAIT